MMNLLIKIFIINYFTYLIFAVFYVIYSGFKEMFKAASECSYSDYKTVRDILYKKYKL